MVTQKDRFTTDLAREIASSKPIVDEMRTERDALEDPTVAQGLRGYRRQRGGRQPVTGRAPTPETGLGKYGFERPGVEYPYATDAVTARQVPASMLGRSEEEVARNRARLAGQSHYWFEPEKTWKRVEAPREVPLSRIPFSRQIEPLGEVAPFKQIREVFTSPEAERTKEVLSLIGMIGALGYGTYAVATTGWNAFLRASLVRNLNSWSKAQGVKIPAETRNIFVNRAMANLDRRWVSREAVRTIFKPVKGTLRISPEKARDIAEDVRVTTDRVASALVPRGTQTGALAFGGLPSEQPVMAGLLAEYSALVAQAEKLAPTNPDVIRMRELVQKGGREGLAQIDREDLEGKLKGIVAPGVEGVPVAPLPEKPAVVGQQIAKETGLRYDGVQESLGMQFTDVAETGTTFYANTLEEAQTRLGVKRQEFAEAAPIPQAPPREPEAGLQPSMLGGAPAEVRPTGRGRVTQISMDEQLKLEQQRQAAAAQEIAKLEATPEETARLGDELTGLEEYLLTDPIAVRRVTLGNRQVPLTNFISIREQTFPQYFNRRQAEALMQGLKATSDRVPRDVALEQLATEFNMTPDQLAEHIEGVAKTNARITELRATIKSSEAPQRVKNIHKKGQVAPESVSPEEAKLAHVESAAPDGPKLPKPPGEPPTQAKEPSDILGEIANKATPGERPDQTLLRLHEAAIGAESNRTSILVRDGSEKLKAKGIGTWRRGQLIPRPKDIPKLDELYKALHNPSLVESGEITVPKGLEDIYAELRTLTDWEEMVRLDFDPAMATVGDYFYRGWKPPEGAFADVVQGRPLVKTPAFKKPRVNASYQEMRDVGFEPLFWNPYQQWSASRIQGVKYREQMELVEHLKGMGEELIRPHDGGAVPQGWRVPEVGPAFEGKPFAIKDPVTGEPMVMFTRRWIVPDKIANSLENIYGKRPDLGKFVVKGKTIDPMAIIDAITFFPKRAKLFLSFFQQVDFLTRSGAGSWTRFVDALQAGQPIEAIKGPARYPVTLAKVLRANFSPTARKSLAKSLNSTEPLVEGRPGINLKGISEAGLSTRDVTIFPADMDKLIRQVATETGVLGKGKRLVSAVGDLESAMRRGLFDGVYPAAIITDIQNNIASMIARQYPSLNDAQINGMIARIANIKYSTIPASQSVIQNRVLREGLRRVFFSIGESEGLLRQATGAFKGPYASFWRKHWLGVWLFLITTANIIHFASTGEPLPVERYSPIAKNNWGPLPFGYNTEFASPTLPFKGRGGAELTLDLAGQMDTAFRVLDPVNFLTSRESVPVRTAMNQVSGTDFYGAPIDDVGPGGIISRISQFLHDLFAPIGVGGITEEVARQAIPGAEEVIPRGEERLGISGLALQATGINIRAETTRNLLDRYAKESGFLRADGVPVESWDDLEPSQKKELSNNEELQTELGLRSEAAIERQQLGAAGFATLDDIDKERIVRGEALVTDFLSKLIEADAFRDEVTLLKREMSARKAQVDIDFQLFEKTGQLPKDPNKSALTEYYRTFDLAKRASGIIDWEKQEALETYYRKKWTDAQEAYVDRNVGLTEWGPLMSDYNQALERLKSYWEVPEKQRKAYREQNPDIDALLVRWYGYKPVVPEKGKLTIPQASATDQTVEEALRSSR